MVKEQQKAVAFTSAAGREEEELEEEDEAVEAELEGSCSESSLGAAVGAGRLSPTDPGGPEELHGPHVATCTFTISLAVPVATSQRHKPSISSEMQRRRSDIGKDAGIPKIRRYYHMEYFLLPDDIEPRKLDLVLFGMVAKFFLESESKGRDFGEKPRWLSATGRSYDMTVDALIVRMLGAWDPSNESILHACHLSRCYSKLMRCLIVTDTICWSRNIYVEHITGRRQYSDPTRRPAAGPDTEGTA